MLQTLRSCTVVDRHVHGLQWVFVFAWHKFSSIDPEYPTQMWPIHKTVFTAPRCNWSNALNTTTVSEVITFTFTFMHLADAFIQSDLQLHSGYTISLVCVFPGNQTHNLLRCWRNALPLSHTGTALQRVQRQTAVHLLSVLNYSCHRMCLFKHA